MERRDHGDVLERGAFTGGVGFPGLQEFPTCVGGEGSVCLRSGFGYLMCARFA